MQYLILLLSLLVSAVNADIYRKIDSQGNIIFSDQSDSDTEKITLQEPAITYTLPPVPEPVDVVEPESQSPDSIIKKYAPRDYQVAITSPQYDENIWGAGNVTISVSLTPQLYVAGGHLLLFKVDGQQVTNPQPLTSVSLTNMDRGSHTALVSVIDKNGRVIKNSQSVVFHVHRPSSISR